MSTMKLIKRPDHDPNNPYHYHNAQGEKIVITPEEWEANVGKPYFREIEDAVRAEQAAHPEPEYEVNPNFVRDLRSTYAGNMGNGYQNYRNFSSSLPQGYSFTDEGMIVDPQGNYYVQSGYRQTPRFTYSIDNPLQFTIHKDRPIERNLTFYSVNMDKRVKAPLPVDKVMNVREEYENAIDNYINNNDSSEKKYHLPVYTVNMFNDGRQLNYGFFINPETASIGLYLPNRGDPKDRVINEIRNTYTGQKSLYDANTLQKIRSTLIKEHKNYSDFQDVYNFMIKQLDVKAKPSRKEAEKKAVISIGPLEKVNTFDNGGKLKLISRY